MAVPIVPARTASVVLPVWRSTTRCRLRPVLARGLSTLAPGWGNDTVRDVATTGDGLAEELGGGLGHGAHSGLAPYCIDVLLSGVVRVTIALLA